MILTLRVNIHTVIFIVFYILFIKQWLFTEHKYTCIKDINDDFMIGMSLLFVCFIGGVGHIYL